MCISMLCPCRWPPVYHTVSQSHTSYLTSHDPGLQIQRPVGSPRKEMGRYNISGNLEQLIKLITCCSSNPYHPLSMTPYLRFCKNLGAIGGDSPPPFFQRILKYICFVSHCNTFVHTSRIIIKFRAALGFICYNKPTGNIYATKAERHTSLHKGEFFNITILTPI